MLARDTGADLMDPWGDGLLRGVFVPLILRLDLSFFSGLPAPNKHVSISRASLPHMQCLPPKVRTLVWTSVPFTCWHAL